MAQLENRLELQKVEIKEGTAKYNDLLAEYFNAKGDISIVAEKCNMSVDDVRATANKFHFAKEYRLHKASVLGLVSDLYKSKDKMIEAILDESMVLLEHNINIDFILMDKFTQKILDSQDEINKMPIDKVINIYLKLEEANYKRIEMFKAKAEMTNEESGMKIIIPNMNAMFEMFDKLQEQTNTLDIFKNYKENVN